LTAYVITDKRALLQKRTVAILESDSEEISMSAEDMSKRDEVSKPPSEAIKSDSPELSEEDLQTVAGGLKAPIGAKLATADECITQA
jgi:hypothetical protein